MLLVRTRLKNSAIHGLGLFADQFIEKDTPLWKFVPGFDIELTSEQLEQLSEAARTQTLRYSYFNPKTRLHVLCSDDARFFNHSDDPNTTTIDSPEHPEGIVVATRDITAGEELTCDYREFDDFDPAMLTSSV
jgi:uncharacterized protein